MSFYETSILAIPVFSVEFELGLMPLLLAHLFSSITQPLQQPQHTAPNIWLLSTLMLPPKAWYHRAATTIMPQSLQRASLLSAHILCCRINSSINLNSIDIIIVVINTCHRQHIDKVRQSITQPLQFYCNLHGHCKHCSHLVHFFGRRGGINNNNNTSPSS